MMTSKIRKNNCEEIFFIKESFCDFDAFTHAAHAWDLDFVQLSKGSCATNMLQLGSGKCLLSNVKFNQLYAQAGSTPPGRWTFAIFAEQTPSIMWYDGEIPNNTLIVFKPGSEIDCVSKPGFENYTLSYTDAYLNTICANLGLPEMRDIVNGTDSFSCHSVEFFDTRRQLQQIVSALHHLPRSEDVLFAQILEDDLPEQILLLLSKSLPTKRCSTRRRNHALKRTKEYLLQAPHKPITVSQLCKIAKVSMRTLQYAYLEHYGVTPKTYMKNLRLNNVRHELWKSNPNITRVNDISTIWGFWHMGQFAADYRNLFNELPSETLRKPPPGFS